MHIPPRALVTSVILAVGLTGVGAASAQPQRPSAEEQLEAAYTFDAAASTYARDNDLEHPYAVEAVDAGARALPQGWKVIRGEARNGELVRPSLTLEYHRTRYIAVYFSETPGQVSAVIRRPDGKLRRSLAAERDAAIVSRERQGLGSEIESLRAAARELSRSFPGLTLAGVEDRNGDGVVDGKVQVRRSGKTLASFVPGPDLETSAKSDLRNLAVSEEILLTDTNSYGTIAQMRANKQDVRAARGVRLKVVRYQGAEHYCLAAQYRDETGSHTLFYDSLAGGLQPAGTKSCPQATRGRGGDSLEGRSAPEPTESSTFTYEPEPAEDPVLVGDITAKSDLRNLATGEEILLTDTNSYGTIAQMELNGQSVVLSSGVIASVALFDGARGYCLTARHIDSPNYILYDSLIGGFGDGEYTSELEARLACSLEGGVPGDSRSGV